MCSSLPQILYQGVVSWFYCQGQAVGWRAHLCSALTLPLNCTAQNLGLWLSYKTWKKQVGKNYVEIPSQNHAALSIQMLLVWEFSSCFITWTKALWTENCLFIPCMNLNQFCFIVNAHNIMGIKLETWESVKLILAKQPHQPFFFLIKRKQKHCFHLVIPVWANCKQMLI